MALIKWKQLSKDLSTHANLTGSLKVTGSILLNGSAVSTAQASTGSLISTASATNNVITFTKGNNSTFNITVATGSGGGSSDLGALNSFSASVNTFTGSIDGEVTALMAATSSYVTNANTSSFISNSQTGSFLKDADTGSFITNSDTGSFLTDTDTGSFISNSQTSSMSVASASFNPVAYLSASTTHSLTH